MPVKLYAYDLYFRGDSPKDKKSDLCVHGRVVFEIDNELLSDDAEWCVSASAYRFLHTLSANHRAGAEEHMIPCCGHFMIPSEDNTKVTIIGCTNGIDFDIIHKNENIMIRTRDNKTYAVPSEEYKAAVIAFAKQIEDFYRQNPAREIKDEFDRDGFSAFLREWRDMIEQSQGFS